MTMKWVSTLSRARETADALSTVCEGLRAAFSDAQTPDLIMMFATANHVLAMPDLAARVLESFPGATLVGCSGGSVIGDGREVEEGPALSLTAAYLPDVVLSARHVTAADLPAAGDQSGWETLVDVRAEQGPSFIVLPSLFGWEEGQEPLLEGLDAAFPEAVKVGGIASGDGQRSVAVYVGGEKHRDGAAVLAMHGAIDVRVVLAQGCKPIGEPMAITDCDDHLVRSLNGESPVEVIRTLFKSLGPRDQALFRRSLFAGIEMRDQRSYKQGDFLIRNVLGVDAEQRIVAVAAKLKKYQALQFHVRDAASSAEDLDRQLDRHRDMHPSPPSGALLFSCLGRGEHLYGHPNHDSDAMKDKLGTVPLGGFFCNGEIGPVSGTTYVHGYTSAFALFSTPPDA